jgi:hypothetical protein
MIELPPQGAIPQGLPWKAGVVDWKEPTGLI